MLEKRDIIYAEKVLSDLQDNVTLDFFSADHPENKNFERFVEEVSSLFKKIRFEVKETEGGHLPAIVVGGKLYYHAIPDKTEFAPFIDAVSTASRKIPPVNTKTETDIKIVVMPGCIYCPNAVRNTVGFAFSNNGVKVSIIDGMMFKETIERFDIKSAPTTIINEKLFLSGVIPEDDLSEWVSKATRKRFSRDDLIKMIKDQNAYKLADMMIEDGTISKEFLSVLWDDKWPLRLGAMVVLEDIYEKKPALIKTVIKDIERHLFDNDLRNRCDAAFLIGNIGGKDSIDALKSAMTKRDETFIECAEEAVSLIEKRG